MERIYAVSVIGFNATERIILGSIFNLSMRRNPSYRDADDSEPPDLLLVDGAHPACVDEAIRALAQQPAAVLLVAEGDLDTGWQFVERPLHWARLFKSMDLALGFLTHGPASHQPGARPAPPRYDMPAELTGVRAVMDVSALRTPDTPPPRSITADEAPADRVLYASAGARIGDQVSQAIAATGARVDVAQRGEHALELIEQGGYACLFLDAALPGIDGYQLCRLVKAKFRAADLAVILLNAGASAFERIRGSIAGCDAFLDTPVSAEELRAVAARMMPRRSRTVPSKAVPHA